MAEDDAARRVSNRLKLDAVFRRDDALGKGQRRACVTPHARLGKARPEKGRASPRLILLG